MKYTVQERLTIMNEVLKVVEGDKAAIKMADSGIGSCYGSRL